MTRSTRDAFGEALVALADDGLDFVVVDGGVSGAARTAPFEAAYPDRFLNCGISEQNMVSVAAGLAWSGVPVVAASFAAFLINRAFDQIRLQVAQPGLRVTLVGSHAGITAGPDGISAHAIEDLALVSALPGFSVGVPVDGAETASMLRTMVTGDGPSYLRVSKHKTPVAVSERPCAAPGSLRVLRPGSDVTIVSHGVMVPVVLEAAERLEADSVSVEVVNAPWVSPFDEAALAASARRTGCVLVVTEHLGAGGLVGAVTAALARRAPVPADWVAVPGYAGSAPAGDLLRSTGLTVDDVVDAARSLLARASGAPAAPAHHELELSALGGGTAPERTS
ncbi:transketolase family protein [Cellulomonas fimi]|uniref:transketolase family protein n=1 Tax=Cellulomonas fimi TaxID=1708 RepID=UPI00235A1C39|nr:transketolase C-terminal domain-containing protein [Cellulomonas fimi]